MVGRYNNVGVDGCRALAVALQQHSLSALRLEHNPIGAEGAERLAAALQTNQALRSLHLEGCAVNQGLRALVVALKVLSVGLSVSVVMSLMLVVFAVFLVWQRRFQYF